MNKPLALVVDDEISLRELYSRSLKELGTEVMEASSAEEALSILKNNKPSIVISDVKMADMDGIELLRNAKDMYPELPFLLVTAYASIRDAVNSLKLGAVDYLEKPIDLDELKIAVSNILNIKSPLLKFEFPKDSLEGIIAQSSVMQNLFNDAYRIAKSDVTVLITGESGSGKEVVASFIHKNSLRSKMPLLTMNCASLPANIIGSELFGHEKGAFTGAVSTRLGKFRESHKGTLFLDEIGDMPIELQSSLLRAIENKKVCPLGSDRETETDVRIITATNKILESEIKKNRFRMDLYYRLNVIALEVPPLRNRKDDIIPLARYFLKSSEGSQKRLSANTIRLLENYTWPGNVRELSNAMKRAKILSRTELIMPEHLPPDIRKNAQSYDVDREKIEELLTLEQSEMTSIKVALKNTNGNQTKAANLLGISRRTLINKLKKLDMM